VLKGELPVPYECNSYFIWNAESVTLSFALLAQRYTLRTESDQKVMRLILYKKVTANFLDSNLFPFQVGPFRSNSLLEAFLPSLKALLEVFCEFLQCVVGYGSLDAVNRLEMITS
jgi:hypothetical protein